MISAFQPLVKFKNYIYFEERDDTRTGETNLKPTNGGQVTHVYFSFHVSSFVALGDLLQERR